MHWIDATVTRKNPLQLEFPVAAWTPGMAAALRNRTFDIALAANSVACFRQDRDC